MMIRKENDSESFPTSLPLNSLMYSLCQISEWLQYVIHIFQIIDMGDIPIKQMLFHGESEDSPVDLGLGSLMAWHFHYLLLGKFPFSMVNSPYVGKILANSTAFMVKSPFRSTHPWALACSSRILCWPCAFLARSWRSPGMPRLHVRVKSVMHIQSYSYFIYIYVIHIII